MTEVEIHGGPLDGSQLDTAGNPEPGELVHHDGSRYRLYEKTDGHWLAIWAGFDGNRPSVDDLNDAQIERLIAALDEETPGQVARRRLGAGLVIVVSTASLGMAFAVSLAILAGIGAAIEALARLVGGWTRLALGFGALGAIVAAVAAVSDPESLDGYMRRPK